MPSFKTIVYKTIAEDLIGQAVEEWNSMWHNASISWWPDDIEGRWEEWSEWLANETQLLCEIIEYNLKDVYALDWKIYQWGRSGATIAPEPTVVGKGSYRDWLKIDNDYLASTLGWDNAQYLEDEFGDDNDSWTEIDNAWHEIVKEAQKYFEAIRYINETVKSAVQSLPELWKEYEQSNAEKI